MFSAWGRRAAAVLPRSASSAVASAGSKAAGFAANTGGRRLKTTLVLMRHGQSVWNLENRFTGWVDVDLTEQGRGEAAQGGREMAKEGFEFDVVHTSMLQRAIKTMWGALTELNQVWLPVSRDWRLNERHYGALSGLNKAETTSKHGEEQVTLWRRSYDIPPPPLDKSNEHWPGHDRRYKGLPEEQLPVTESLATTGERVVPWWQEVAVPDLKAGKNVLVVAHGNSLRALVKHLDNISKEDIVGLNIPTGVPLVYELDDDLSVVPSDQAIGPLRGRYLGDQDEIRAKVESVANQSKAK